MKDEIWVAGEALIDEIVEKDSISISVGGGGANTAKALGALGCNVQYLGSISSDDFGNTILKELDEYKVGLQYINCSNLPTAKAIATIDNFQNASYQFKLKDTSSFNFDLSWLPKNSPKVLHIGSLATVIEPGASNLYQWVSGMKADKVFDPNVRQGVGLDMQEYRRKLIPWFKISNVVKLSDQDLNLLQLNINDLLDFGIDLVILTKGSAGISAFTKRAKVEVPAIKVEVIDTIGAGDVVGAIVAEALFKGINFDEVSLSSLLNRAALAASITCSRVGAKPPYQNEIR